MTTRDHALADVGLLSPELALVDDALAAYARVRLVEPEDTLARLEHDVWLRRLAALERAQVDHRFAEDPAARPDRSRRQRRLLTGRRGTALLAATAASSITVALLLGVNVNFRGAPAGADSFETTTAPAPIPLPDPTPPLTSPPASQPPKSQPPVSQPSKGLTPRPARSPGTTTRTFAWAPVPDASGYHVELFRGETRVFVVDVSAPRFELPASWTHAGRVQRLHADTYRWNVWPVVAGLRRSQATVQAELVVP